jgi:hypothetical protein
LEYSHDIFLVLEIILVALETQCSFTLVSSLPSQISFQHLGLKDARSYLRRLVVLLAAQFCIHVFFCCLHTHGKLVSVPCVQTPCNTVPYRL